MSQESMARDKSRSVDAIQTAYEYYIRWQRQYDDGDHADVSMFLDFVRDELSPPPPLPARGGGER